MKPSREDDAVVDLLDVVLRDGVVVRADVVVTVADVPLIGIDLRAAVAGMTAMTEYGILESEEGEGGTGSTGTREVAEPSPDEDDGRTP